MEKKIQKVFIDEGFGFKVRILNASMVKVRGEWTPNINYNELAKVVLHALCHKPGRLSGAEIRFIRQHFEMTLQAFANRFCVTHVAVIKWERAKNKPTTMAWTTEKDLRLFVLSKLHSKASEIATLYTELEKERKNAFSGVDVDAREVA
jgi:DNA-binding transcriptional regulator YiaG